jgi:hypothetical protein
MEQEQGPHYDAGDHRAPDAKRRYPFNPIGRRMSSITAPARAPLASPPTRWGGRHIAPIMTHRAAHHGESGDVDPVGGVG